MCFRTAVIELNFASASANTLLYLTLSADIPRVALFNLDTIPFFQIITLAAVSVPHSETIITSNDQLKIDSIALSATLHLHPALALVDHYHDYHYPGLCLSN